MYLAINYSAAAAVLVSAGQLQIDYFKTPDWDWIINEARQLKPVVVHFTLDAGNDSLREVDWEMVQRLSRMTDTPFINLHLDARQDHYPGFAIDTADKSEVEIVLRTILSDVENAVNQFGPGRVIIENSPYQQVPGNTMRLCVEPRLITRVIQETNCGLLLDISHAVIAAQFLGMSLEEYVSQLPIDYVKELHFAGIHRDQATSQLTDHLSILEEDWHWLDWVLEHIHYCAGISPWLLAFEYGGVGEVFRWRSSPEVIAEQVPQLYEHLKILNIRRS